MAILVLTHNGNPPKPLHPGPTPPGGWGKRLAYAFVPDEGSHRTAMVYPLGGQPMTPLQWNTWCSRAGIIKPGEQGYVPPPKPVEVWMRDVYQRAGYYSDKCSGCGTAHMVYVFKKTDDGSKHLYHCSYCNRYHHS